MLCSTLLSSKGRAKETPILVGGGPRLHVHCSSELNNYASSYAEAKLMHCIRNLSYSNMCALVEAE